MKRHSEKSFSPEASDHNHKVYGEGTESYKSGKYSRAINSFKEALEYWPLDPQAWFALGNCYDEVNKPRKAEKSYRKALKYSPSNKHSEIYFNLGNSLYDQKSFEEAISFYNKVSAQSIVYEAAQKNLLLAERELEKA